MEKSIETILDELEAIITAMDQGSLTLEEAFASYESGMKLIKECNNKIDRVEKKILILQEAERGEEDDER